MDQRQVEPNVREIKQQSFIHRIHKYMQPHFRNAQPVINGGGFHEQKVVTEEKERIFLDQLKIPSARDQDQPNVGPSVQNPRIPSTHDQEVTLNSRPIIGILSHPGDGANGRLDKDINNSYIAASYVRLVQSGGARVIPLVYNEKQDSFKNKLNMVNGVVFTGGRCFEGPYIEAIKLIFRHTLKLNKEGHYFPLLGICLGFEIMMKIVSEDENILGEFDSVNLPSTLQIRMFTNIQGTLFERVPANLLDKLSSECLVQQSHRLGISGKVFLENMKLIDFFKILAMSTDRNKNVYVSAVQARDYPIFGVQWHPEKNAFEWAKLLNIPHSEAAVEVSHHIICFFVSEAGKDSRLTDNSEVLKHLIYNHKPTFCGVEGRGYDEVYIFK